MSFSLFVFSFIPVFRHSSSKLNLPFITSNLSQLNIQLFNYFVECNMAAPPSYRDLREENFYMTNMDALDRWSAYAEAEKACTAVPPKTMVRSFCVANTHLILATDEGVTTTYQFTRDKSFFADSRTELTCLKETRLVDVRYGLEHQAFLTLEGNLLVLGSLAYLYPINDSVGCADNLNCAEDGEFEYHYVRDEAKQPKLAWNYKMGSIKAIRCGAYFTAFLVETRPNKHRVVVFGKNPYYQYHGNHKQIIQFVTEELNVDNPVAIEAGSCFLAILTDNGQVVIWYGHNRKFCSGYPQLLHNRKLANSFSHRIKPPGKFSSLLHYFISPNAIKAIACCTNELIVLANNGVITCYGPHTFQGEPDLSIINIIENKISGSTDVDLGNNKIVELAAHESIVVLKRTHPTTSFFVFGDYKGSNMGKKPANIRSSQSSSNAGEAMKLKYANKNSFEEMFAFFSKVQTTPRLYHLKQIEADFSARPNIPSMVQSPVSAIMPQSTPSSGSNRSQLFPPRQPNRFDIRDAQYFNEVVTSNRKLETWNDYKALESEMQIIARNIPEANRSTRRTNQLAKMLTWICLPRDIQAKLTDRVKSEAEVDIVLAEILGSE